MITKIARRTVKDAVLWGGTRTYQSHSNGSTARDPSVGSARTVGREEFVKNQLAKKFEEHQVLMDPIPLVQDLQAAWLLLFYCDI